MSALHTNQSGRQPWQIVGLWMVFGAVVLAFSGIGLAVRQAQTLSTRLMNQARDRAAYIAEEVRSELNEHISALLSTVCEQMQRASPGAGISTADLPAWVDGLYAGENSAREDSKLLVLSPSVNGGTELTDKIESWLAQLPTEQEDDRLSGQSQLLHRNHNDTQIVIAYRHSQSHLGVPLVVAANLQLQELRRLLIQPLLGGADGLELGKQAESERSHKWFQVMDGAARPWVIQPTDAFLREQRLSVMGQTVAYLGLTVLSLATLLLAMFFVVRVARREMALAEMKSNFVADVSHELKTPLATIRLFAETLQSGRVASEEKRGEYYSIISRESERLTHLIDNILDFARIDAGRREYTFEPQDVGAIVREIYDTYSVQLDHNGFQHSLKIAENLPRVDADKDAIAQVIVNLMTNAIKYSDEDKSLTIDVVEDTRRDQRGVLISVQDHGIGINPEDRARLTEGFFRAADGRVRQRGGTGLGLALVKRIVEAHHGTLEVESRLVKGSTFRVFFPESENK